MDNQGHMHIASLGVTIRYAQVDTGPDILFLHGAPGSMDDWLPMKDGLAANFRLTLYDRPGYGGSDTFEAG